MKQFARLCNCRKGATAIEYGLIVALVAIVLVGSISLVGDDLKSVFATVAGAISGQDRCTEVGSNCDGSKTE